MPVRPEDLDADPWLFNCANGTLELKTGLLRPHRREDLLTKVSPVEYDPSARCGLWLEFLRWAMKDDEGMVAYLQRVAGYCLTADVSEQCLWFFHGAGANGKSTFLTTLLAMLGDYGAQGAPGLLAQKGGEAHPTEQADLHGRRLVAVIETEEGKRLAEATLKQLAGGDRIKARKMRQDFWEFEPTHKFFLAANHKPVIRGTDHAVWRRIKLVPFTATVAEHEKDRDLPKKLRAELSGILAWAVRGCLAWRRDGLQEPEAVTRATRQYRGDQDTVEGFLHACCLQHPSAKAKSSLLFDAYVEFSGDKLLTSKAFGDRLREKGFESKKGGGGCYFWHGLGLQGNEVAF
jgi:putative DNA primase/helicase